MYITSLNWFTSLQPSMHLKVQFNFDGCHDENTSVMTLYVIVYMGMQMQLSYKPDI